METVLKEFFGYVTFRPFQKDIMTKILNGTDCLVVMATGSGKSICYQMPPMITKKTAVVISPLISLMQDQVMGLQRRGISAQYLSSAQTDMSVSTRAQRGEYDVLYMTPEKACSSSASFWSSLLMGKGVCLLAVDEAHCVSEWGHDFRQEYQNLHKLRPHLPKVPFVALTATATHSVREDIISSLKLRNYFSAISTFDRPNIFYGVRTFNRTSTFREELGREILKDIKDGSTLSGSTLIYCTTVKDVQEVTDALQSVGVVARPYHAQMPQRIREETHLAFAEDTLQVVVATVAFGMGIDKPDIRRVIHYGCPKSLEAYYQESGRCGRDGQPSTSWLYFTRQDFTKGDFYAGGVVSAARKEVIRQSYSAAQQYCQSTSCRRAMLLEYFGETVSEQNCGNCDNCTGPVAERRDMAEEGHLLLSAVHLCGGKWGLIMPVDVLRGGKGKKVLQHRLNELPFHGLGRGKSQNWWKALGDQLLRAGYLKETFKATMHTQFKLVSITPQGLDFLSSASTFRASLILPLTSEMEDEERKQSGAAPAPARPLGGGVISTAARLASEGFSEVEIKLYNRLLEARLGLARRNGTAPYAICKEETLQKIAKCRPSNEARLTLVDGVNYWLVTHHGAEILAIIKDFAGQNGLGLDCSDSGMPGGLARPVNPAARGSRDPPKITAVKEEALRMWQGGLSFSAIATLPARGRTIRPETVISYILECVTAGYELDWDRFKGDVGLTEEIVTAIQAAVEKVGSSEFLKPLKDVLPDSITYEHLKVFKAMQGKGLPSPSLPQLQEIKQETQVSGLPLESRPLESRPLESQVLDSQALDSQDEQLPQKFPDLVNETDGSTKPQDTISESFVKPPWISSDNEAAATKPRRRLPNFSSQVLNKRSKVEDF